MHFCLEKKNKHMAAATKADKESVSLRILPHPAPDYESGVFSLVGASPRKAITIYTEELFKNRNKVKYHHCPKYKSSQSLV